jgi:hypothetical protein
LGAGVLDTSDGLCGQYSWVQARQGILPAATATIEASSSFIRSRSNIIVGYRKATIIRLKD